VLQVSGAGAGGALRCKALHNFSPCCGQTGWDRRHHQRINAIKLEAAPRYHLQRFAPRCNGSHHPTGPQFRRILLRLRLSRLDPLLPITDARKPPYHNTRTPRPEKSNEETEANALTT